MVKNLLPRPDLEVLSSVSELVKRIDKLYFIRSSTGNMNDLFAGPVSVVKLIALVNRNCLDLFVHSWPIGQLQDTLVSHLKVTFQRICFLVHSRNQVRVTERGVYLKTKLAGGQKGPKIGLLSTCSQLRILWHGRHGDSCHTISGYAFRQRTFDFFGHRSNKGS